MTSVLTVDADGLHDPRRRTLAIVAVLAAMALVVLDAAMTNVALPTISESLNIAPAASIWVVTAYQLGLVISLLPASALGESLGFRKVFVAGAAVFIVASLICALSPTLEWLVAARFMQGLGGACIMALGVALLRLVVPHHRFGAAIGWNALTVALASAAGPTLGSTILTLSSWPWLFAVNLPLGALVIHAATALPGISGTGRALDGVSVMLSVMAFAALVVGSDSLASNAMLAAVLLAAAACLGWLLVQRERAAIAPLIPIDLLRQRSFRLSVAASTLLFIAQSAALVALPFYLQHVLGLTPLVIGLYLLPWPLAVAFVGPLAGRLANSIATSWLCLFGGLFLFAGLTASLLSHSAPALPASMAVCGVGFGLFNVSNNRNMFLSAPRERSGAAGGMQGLARLTGQVLGAVSIAALFKVLPLPDAPRVGLLVGAILALSAGALSMLHPWRPLRS